MFHAVIHRERDRLRLSGRVVPYDVQLLREHLLARRGPATRVEVRLPPPLRRAFLSALGDVERRGVTLTIAR
ncbi:MAG TPA: hypothetical protein VFD84_00325 [Candidatus Binatia bacterium]|jgi:hypothetical protein|nr:hypothetical protein [Candidatus Binatia bacterium]